MQRQLKYRIQVIGTMLLALASCTERIDLELDTTNTRLVVFGTVTSDFIRHVVELTTTSDYFLNESTPRVSGARVEVSFERDTVLFREVDTLPGIYRSEKAFRGNPGTTYHLKISQVDMDQDGKGEIYESFATMPGGFSLDSIQLEYFTSYFVSGYQMYIFARDPASTRDWYSLRYYRNGQPVNDTLWDYSVQSDDFYNGNYLFYGVPVAFFTDDDPVSVLVPGDTLTLELQSVEEVFYDFVGDAQLEILGNIPLFSGPPANVVTNISNNAVGIFAAYSLQRASVIVPDQ